MKKLLLVLLLAGCASVGGFPDRYRTEMGALTVTRQSTAVMVTLGSISRERAQKVLADTDTAAAALSVARMLEAPGDSSLQQLADADAVARLALVAAIGK